MASTVLSAGDLVGQAGTLWTQPRASVTWGDLGVRRGEKEVAIGLG